MLVFNKRFTVSYHAKQRYFERVRNTDYKSMINHITHDLDTKRVIHISPLNEKNQFMIWVKGCRKYVCELAENNTIKIITIIQQGRKSEKQFLNACDRLKQQGFL